jgi:ComF family protein
MRDLIHALKYERLYPVGRRLGLLLAETIAPLATEAAAETLVVPVPLHRSRHAERGFNQSRILAAEAIAALRKRMPDWRLTLAPSTLVRLRATETQAGLTTRQRRVNVRGAFGVKDRSAVAGKHILLIDDVLTTGATARAASRALLQAGAESVLVATLARAHRVDQAFRSSLIGLERAETHLAEGRSQRATMNLQDQPSF